MRAARADRLWMVGGVLGAVVLLAIGWFFFIGQQKSQAANLKDQTAAADLRLGTLERRIVELRAQQQDLPEYRARLARDRQALPNASALSDFLRELQASGTRVGADVSGIIVGAPTQVAAAGTEIHALPITLTAEGSTAELNRFLTELQQVQPRAVLISGVTAMPDGDSKSLDGGVTVTITAQVFVAPPTAAGTPGPAAKTN